VDVIDTGEFPLANFPHYAGLQFEQAAEALKIFLAEADGLLGLTLTEVNPNNDPSGDMVTRVVDTSINGLHRRKELETNATQSTQSKSWKRFHANNLLNLLE
jgi:arginase family enzyme